MKDVLSEIDNIKQKSQKSVNELRGLSNFFKIFTQTYQDEVTMFKNRLSEHEQKYQLLDDSILSANLVGIYECFRQYNVNTQKLMTKINNELINPYDVFRNTQFSIYQNNINELREVNKLYKEDKDLLEMAQYNYYQACDVVKKENQEKKFFFSKKGITNHDMNVQNNMKAKNYEIIYKFELEKYNKSIVEINDRYNKIYDKIQLADKSRIMFIKTSFDKFRSYMEEYIKNIKDFLNVVENYISDDICTKDEKHNLEKLSKNKKSNFADQGKFISFNDFVEKEKKNKTEKEILKYQMIPTELKLMKTDEKEVADFLKNISNDFLSENEVEGDKIAKLIELFQFKDNNSDIEKKFMDSILEKRKISSIRFYNLKNLEHLATVLSYITFLPLEQLILYQFLQKQRYI